MEESYRRFARQIALPGFGIEAQRRLASSSVLVAGVGGLGGPLALELAAAGVGKLTLVHEGVLILEDLNRQILMPEDGLGRPRAELAKEAIQRFSKTTRVHALSGFVRDLDLDALQPKPDLIVDCRHNFKDREALGRFAVRTQTPLLEVAMYAFEGQVVLLDPPRTPCLFCLFPSFPSWDPRFGVLGAHAGLMGCLGALVAVSFLGMGAKEYYGTLGLIRVMPLEVKKIKLKKRTGCVCQAC
ncbi:MAG: ThiF family adenylyltransferase [Nitrospirota bacterium]|nr:ThiF family adenylyltransferase [Nitrospirota bacterium]